MSENIRLRKIRQHMQRTTAERFWNEMNVIHNQAYMKAIKHMNEALECTPGISKKQVAEVMARAQQIAEQWDNMHQVEVSSSIDEITKGR